MTEPLTDTLDTTPKESADTSPPPSSTTVLDTAHWRHRLEELIATYQVPGAALGILRDGAITEVSAGVLSKNTLVPATPDALWQIGSISKVWTATVILQLRDEGRLELDQPVTDLLPDFHPADPDAAATVTVRRLLNHTSGIDGDVFTDTGRGDDCVSVYLSQVGDIAQNHPVGATWSYCNSGYVVLGALIERLTGQTWDQAIQERICQRLGLTHTTTLPEDTLRFRSAVGHVGKPGEDPQPTPVMLLPRALGPAGLINARVHDQLAFVRAHLAAVGDEGSPLLTAESAALMREHAADVPDPYTLGAESWGLGWIRFDWDGRHLIGHDGSTLGQNAFLRVLPEEGVAVTLFTNGGRTRELFQEVFTEVFTALAGVAPPPAFAPPENPPELDITPWLGTYERASVRSEVRLDDDGRPVMVETPTGVIAELVDDDVQELSLVAVAEGLYAAYVDAVDTYLPVTFYQLEDGTRYLHHGVRANPMTQPAHTGEDPS